MCAAQYLVLALALFGNGLRAQEPPSVPEGADEFVVARAGQTELRWQELDELLLLRHGMSQPGREILHFLSEKCLVEVAAREGGVAVSEAEVDARSREIEQQVKASSGQSLEQHLETARLSPAEMRYFLKIGMQQEELTRRALGLKAGAPVSPDQARLWIQEAFTDRQYTELPAPWTDGIVARATGFSVSVQDYVRTLRRRLPAEELRTDCYQFLLCRRVRARMPDVAQSKIDEYVQKEIERRRKEAALDPKNKGLSFENLLAAQGLSLDSLARDPGLVVSALSKLWVDRAYNAETLKRTYQDHRPEYDDLYGEAIDVSMLFLSAAQFKNPLVLRTFSEADAELKRLAGEMKTLAEFQKTAKQTTEDASTKESGGALGWVTSGSRSVPSEVRAQVKQRLAALPTPAQLAGEGLVGPLRTSTGCVLLWLGVRRPAPTWEVMAGYVQRELRRQALEEALPRDSVTYNLGKQ